MTGSPAKAAFATLATVVELVFGVLTGILLLSLVPGDEVHTNVVGALVLATLTGAVYAVASVYRRRAGA